MFGFLARQPNGLLCRHSSLTDCVIDYNMTEQDYINLCKKQAEKDAREILKHHVRDFEEIKRCFYANNMTEMEFQNIIKEMETPVEIESINYDQIVRNLLKSQNQLDVNSILENIDLQDCKTIIGMLIARYNYMMMQSSIELAAIKGSATD